MDILKTYRVQVTAYGETYTGMKKLNYSTALKIVNELNSQGFKSIKSKVIH